jgi:hypothetical protein
LEEKEEVYVVIQNDFDGVWYDNKVVAIFKDRVLAQDFVDKSSLDLEIEEHFIE